MKGSQYQPKYRLITERQTLLAKQINVVTIGEKQNFDNYTHVGNFNMSAKTTKTKKEEEEGAKEECNANK